LAAPALIEERRLAVDARLAELARARGAVRRALAAIAGRIVATRTWERLGFARIGDYAIEHAGLSGRSLYDLARVDGALRNLPQISSALVRGEITWTKARLLARVATREDEAWWLARARRLTADALSREVRRVDLGSLESGGLEVDEDGAPTWPRESVVIPCSRGVNGLWFYARQLAQRAAGERLEPWQSAENIAAEVLSAIPLDEISSREMSRSDERAQAEGPSAGERAAHDGVGDGKLPPPGTCPAAPNACTVAPDTSSVAPNACTPIAEWPSGVRPLLEGLEEADPLELDVRLRRAVALEQGLNGQIGPLLREIVDGSLHRALGFERLDDYVRERLGMSPQRGRALVRLERVGAPALLCAYWSGRLSWVQAQALLPVLVTEGRAFAEAWIAWAEGVMVRRLRDDVDAALELRETDPEAFEATGGVPGAPPPERQTRAQPSAPEETSRVFFVGPPEVTRLFRAVLCTVRRRIERREGRPATPGEALAAMLVHVIVAWGGLAPKIPAAYRVFERDGWRCTVPGCSSRRNLHDHHIVFRSAGGSNALENRTTLCAWHHLRGVHGGIVRIRGRAPDRLLFELPVGTYASGDVVRRRTFPVVARPSSAL
jgi:hypothetical protein